MKNLFFVIFLAFLLSSSSALAQEYPTLTKYVNDYAGVLSETERVQINDLCSQIEQNWTVEIAVLTINTTQPTTIEDYAVRTFEKNGIGKKDTDNGLLIVVAVQDKKWRFEVGYGLEPVLNDAKAGNIGRTYLVPNFQNGHYGTGLYQAIEAVGQVIANNGDDSFISNSTGTSNEWLIVVIILSLVIVTIIIVPFVLIVTRVLGFMFNEKCPKCGGRMICTYEGDKKICECQKCGKKTRKKIKKNSWFFLAGGIGSSGGWSGGGGGGGGFGGGSSGGGGASGGW